MRAYIGTKIVQAEPMDQAAAHGVIKDGSRPGYKVVYEDGYVSWSPKEVFERCYREVTEAEKKLID